MLFNSSCDLVLPLLLILFVLILNLLHETGFESWGSWNPRASGSFWESWLSVLILFLFVATKEFGELTLGERSLAEVSPPRHDIVTFDWSPAKAPLSEFLLFDLLLLSNHWFSVLIEPFSPWEWNSISASKFKHTFRVFVRGNTLAALMGFVANWFIVFSRSWEVFGSAEIAFDKVVWSWVWNCGYLLFPNLCNIILNIWWSWTSWSINWEFSVESLSSLSSIISLLLFKRLVQVWSLPSASIDLSIIEAESSLDFLSHSNLLSNGVDLISQVFLSTDASWVDVIAKAVTLHWGVDLGRAGTWIKVGSLFVRLLWVLESVISFV